MKNIFLVSLILGFAQTAIAGEGGTQIKCQSASGKTRVEVSTSDGGSALISASLLNADGKTRTVATFMNKYMSENLLLNGQDPQVAYPGSQVAPVAAIVENHVIAYVVTEVDSNGYDSNPLQLVSTAGSVKFKNGPYSSVKGTFRAQLSGRDPRKNGDYLRSIAVSCTYDYSI